MNSILYKRRQYEYYTVTPNYLKIYLKLLLVHVLLKSNYILGKSFYRKENTKPLFEKYKILAVQNLYTYHCFMETFKILKFRTPVTMLSLYKFSSRSNLTYTFLIPPVPDSQFFYKSPTIWNALRAKLSISDNSVNLADVKEKINVYFIPTSTNMTK